MKAVIFTACITLVTLGGATTSYAQGLVAAEQAPPAHVVSAYQEAGIIFMDLIMASYVTGTVNIQLETPDGVMLYSKSLYESIGGNVQLIMNGVSTKSREHVLRLIMQGETKGKPKEYLIPVLIM